MERFDKLSTLRFWKKLLWAFTACCGAYCLVLFFPTLLEELPQNAASVNEGNRPYYVLFIAMLLHSVSLSVIYKTLRELCGQAGRQDG